MDGGALRQRFPQDEEFLVVDSDEKPKKKFRRVKISEISLAGWVLSAVSFVISMTLFFFVFVPMAVGHITPWELMQGARYQVEDLVRDLADPCPRAISSETRLDIKSASRAVNEITYEMGMNLSAKLQAQEVVAIRKLLSASTAARLGVSPYHLRTSQRGTFHEWTSDRNLKAAELFHRNEHDLESLLPCLAGTYKQDVFPRNVFKKIYREISFKISMETEEILKSTPIVVGGPLVTKDASMAPTLNHFCNSRLLVQVAGDAMVFYRAAREERAVHGMSISPWLGVHLLPGDALTWFPGTLFYIEPLNSWSLAMVIEEIADDITHREAAVRTVDFDVLEDKMYIEKYVQVMTDCHGIWPPTISSRNAG